MQTLFIQITKKLIVSSSVLQLYIGKKFKIQNFKNETILQINF